MKNIAIFASGAGSNAREIINHFKTRSPGLARVGLILTNNPGAGVLEIAAKNHIPTIIIDKEIFFRGSAYKTQLEEKHVDLVVLAGFLWKIPTILLEAFPRRIINIHPALLPKHGGKGMYGNRVHEAVIKNKEAESGITIHYIDDHYDEGDIIFQERCPVFDNDDAESLASRVHTLEHRHYPAIIEKLLKG